MVDVVRSAHGGMPCNYGKRAIAYLIDLFLTVVPAIVSASVGVALLFSRAGIAGWPFILLGSIHVIVFPIVNLVRQGTRGQSFGKAQQNIALVKDDSGAPIGILFAVLRVLIFWVFNSLSAGMFLVIDLLLPAFTKKRQRIVDMMLSTVVVDVASVPNSPTPQSHASLGVFTESPSSLPPPSI